MSEERKYTMGRSEEETQRLIEQSQLYDRVTRRFLHETGLSEGMKVLDIGSGAGDVALTAAEMVGPSGHVVGVDMNPDILETARTRAEAAGYSHVDFVAGNATEVDLDSDFDLVVGRLVLMYVPQPAELIKKLVTHLKPGGTVAFQEVELTPYRAMTNPDTPLLNKMVEWGLGVFEQSGANIGMGFDLFRVFSDAGLPIPKLDYKAPMGGSEDWPGFQYLAASFRSMMPLIEKFGLATAEEIDVDTLADRLWQEVNSTKRPLILPPHVTAFARIDA